jgi:hypothetical protein
MAAFVFVLILIAWFFGSRWVYLWALKDVPEGARMRRASWDYPSAEDVAQARQAIDQRRAERAARRHQGPVPGPDAVFVEPSPTLPGLPDGHTVQGYAREGMVDMRIFMIQQARKRGTTHPEAA